jgi:Fe-S-cluster containining protein
MSDEASAASRLCNACGLCCNGVLFHTVRMQGADSPGELSALGLKLKRKKGARYLLQPCPAHQNGCCSIYEQRPERCRLFACRQLLKMTDRQISEVEALAKIQEAKQRVARLEILLAHAGAKNPKKPLSKRFEAATAEPPDPSTGGEALKRRAELTQAMRELEDLLNRDFRVVKIEPLRTGDPEVERDG